MKALIASLAILIASTAHADKGNLANLPRESQQNVTTDVCASSVTFFGLAVSTTPTAIFNGSSLPWKKAFVQNTTGGLNLIWSISQSVSSSGPDTGFKIMPSTAAQNYIFSDGLLPGATYYLINDGNIANNGLLNEQAVIKLCR